jgi:SHS2 domain-containing protein
MEKYKKIKHLGDLKVRIFGKNRQDLFSNALTAMFESIEPDPVAGREGISRKIEVTSQSEDLLLIDFLNEALYQSDVNNEAYQRVQFKSFNPTAVEAILFGYPVKGFREEIKAVTHHGFEIKETKQGLEAEIIFDI